MAHGQGIWGDIMSGASAVPMFGALPALARGVTQAVEGKNPTGSFLEAVPGLGTVVAGKHIAAGVPHTADPNNLNEADDLTSYINKLTEGQVSGSQAESTAKMLAQHLSGMKASDAASVIAALGKTAPTVATDLQNILNPPAASSTGAAANPYGFDPLSLGQMFSQTLAPWLAGQQQASSAGINADVAAMQKALGGVSPQLQGAYAAAIPSLKAAEDTMNAASTQAVATAPEYDSLVSGLTNAMNAARAAQAAAQAEPYWAATTTGVPPAGGVQALQQQVLQNSLAQGH